jgi:predicted MPP superfamily phosphohydrolase
MIRRLSGAIVVGGILLSLSVAIISRYRSPYRPVLEQIEIRVPRGHDGLAGVRLGFITDTHIGPFVSPADIERAASLLAATKPDIVLLGGDYISESPRYAPVAAEVLGRLAAAATFGGIAVLGNHDISTDQAEVRRELERVGIRVLRNEAVELTFVAGSLWIAGVDETILGRANVEATFAHIPPDAAVLVLCHEPDGADQAARMGAFVQLSGHSHGGQIRLPIVGPLALPPGGRKYSAGMYHIGKMVLYTARGAGVYRPPIRFNCPPEVTLVTLTASA